MFELTTHTISTAYGLSSLFWLTNAAVAPGLFKLPCAAVAGLCLAAFYGIW